LWRLPTNVCEARGEQILSEKENLPMFWDKEDQALLQGTEMQKLLKSDKALMREDWLVGALSLPDTRKDVKRTSAASAPERAKRLGRVERTNNTCACTGGTVSSREAHPPPTAALAETHPRVTAGPAPSQDIVAPFIAEHSATLPWEAMSYTAFKACASLVSSRAFEIDGCAAALPRPPPGASHAAPRRSLAQN
jgi:hypothetical protein